VLGKRIISTRLRSSVTIREENGMAALEAMIHLPGDRRKLEEFLDPIGTALFLPVLLSLLPIAKITGHVLDTRNSRSP
jgi:hypothetical protein